IGDRLDRLLVTAAALFGINPAERHRLYAARAALPAGAGDLFGEAAEKHEPATPPGGPPAPASPIGFLQ
ncbi:MAG: phage terminase small subunit P27 family, partial [Amphiplicatus sp.]